MEFHEDVVLSLLSGENIAETVERLKKEKQRELDTFISELKQQHEEAKLLISCLSMPEGTTGKRVADAIMAELRETHPDVAKRADELIRKKHEAKEQELDRLARS